MDSINNLSIPNSAKALISEYKDHLIDKLGDKVHSVYILGSIAMKSFDKRSSDIDILILLEKELSECDIEVLETIHKRMKSFSRWGEKLECSYVNKESYFEGKPYLEDRIYYNKYLRWEPYGHELVIEREILRKYGISIYGKRDDFMNLRLTKDKIRKTAIQILKDDWYSKNDSIEELSDEYLVYGVLTMCRILFSIDRGEITSKANSVKHVVESYPLFDENMIQEAIEWSTDEKFIRRHEAILYIKKITQDYCRKV